MKGTPTMHHIRQVGGRYQVRLARGGKAVTRTADTLEDAVALRDEMLRAAPARYTPRSNTGHLGITETTIWEGQRPTQCFHVHWQEPRQGGGTRQRFKRIRFGRTRTRAQALKMAIALRAEKTAAKDAHATE